MDRFKKYSLSVSAPLLTIGNVNFLTEKMWGAFEKFYLYCITTPGLVEYYDQALPEFLVSASHDYFQEIKQQPSEKVPNTGLMADLYFENFTVIWNMSGKRNKALMFTVFDMVRKWETENSFLLHKGTLFYFWATTDLIHGDYDEGIILMHKALEEDRRKDGSSRTPNTPAHDFISMNDKPGAFLQAITQDMVEFIKRRLDKYNQTGGQLSYQDLRSKFLDSNDLKFEELKFYFCYNVLKWRRLRKIHKQRNIADDQMAPLIITGLISDLLLVVDGVSKIALNSVYAGYPKNKKIYFSNHLFELAKIMKWTSAATSEEYQVERGLKINEELQKDFSGTIQSLLGSKVGANKVSSLQADLWLSYGLRNFSAHTVVSQKLLWEKFTDVFQSILNSFFLLVQKL